jgi:hypothetical protein
MDAASRGPLGSIILLVSLRARPLATIGAIITILALAFDPAVQQILNYQSRPVLQITTRPQVTRATAFPLDIDPSGWVNATIAGVYSSADRFDRQLSCPSGNCTWQPYQSLGWCSKCQDATSYARIINCTIPHDRIDQEFIDDPTTCLVDFGHGLKPKVLGNFLVSSRSSGSGQGMRGYSSYDSFNRSSFATELVWPLYALADGDCINTTRLGIYNPYLIIGHATSKLCNGTVSSGMCISGAQECVLSACETSLKSSVSNGTSITVKTSTNFGSMSLPILTPYDSEYCWERQANASAASNTTQSGDMPNITTLGNCGRGRLSFWTIRGLSGDELTNVLVDRLSGNWSQTFEIPVQGSNKTVYPVDEPIANSDTMRYMKTNGLPEVLEGVAASLTEFGLRANSSYTTTLEGEVWNTESYVSVSWHWLILPIVLVAGSVLLLTVASFHTYRCKLRLWKSSILPLLYRSLDRDLLDEQPVLRDAGAMATAAETASVKLAGTSRRDRTVLVAS